MWKQLQHKEALPLRVFYLLNIWERKRLLTKQLKNKKKGKRAELAEDFGPARISEADVIPLDDSTHFVTV